MAAWTASASVSATVPPANATDSRGVCRRETHRTPSLIRLGVVVLGLCTALAQADCTAPTQAESVQLKRVSDGDSLLLADGRKVRLLGINTPELKGNQPLAKAAKQALEQYLNGDHELLMVTGEQATDRYGRILAQVYRNPGEPGLDVALLQQGLAWHIAIPPNLFQASCRSDAETKARNQGLGVWVEPSYAPLAASTASINDAGFQRLHGRVIKVSESRHSWWLDLDGPVVVKIDKADLHYFETSGKSRPQQWLHREIAVRGWLVDRSRRIDTQRYAPLQMSLRHPVMLERLD